MWNVDERFEKRQMDSLAALGFSVGSTRGVVRVEKYGCGAEFRQNPDERFQMTILPSIMMKGQFTRLWDAGYQKFLLTDDGRNCRRWPRNLPICGGSTKSCGQPWEFRLFITRRWAP